LFSTQNSLLNQTYSNALVSNNPASFWSQFYNYIYQANAAIEGLSASITLSPSIKNQLMGEAKFIRALSIFYLTNIYGDVPAVTTTDYNINKPIARSPQNQIYSQVIADLKDAQALLSDDYLGPDGSIVTEKVRPNKAAATAMLARTYLYMQKWDSAEVEASAVIGSNKYQLVSDLNAVFLKNSAETILNLETPNGGYNTFDAQSFLAGYLYNGGQPSASYPFTMSDDLINEFESGDARKSNWTMSSTVAATTYYFPFKYKLFYTGAPPEEYPVLLRLAEQYLIRAESRAQLSDLAGAATDLNMIRSRAGLANTTASTQSDLIDAIYNERRVELFTEYGQRWFDLKRSEKIDAVMSVITALKGGSWETTDQLYPIPLNDLQADPNLTQNPGYH
jgi:starch-binding outer membrane protein, SusD/RagB family